MAAFDLKSNGADKEAHAEKHTSKLLISQVKMRAMKTADRQKKTTAALAIFATIAQNLNKIRKNINVILLILNIFGSSIVASERT